MNLSEVSETRQARYELAVEHARSADLSGLAIRWQQSLWQIANKSREYDKIDLPKGVYKTSKRDTERILAAARVACTAEFPPVFSLAPLTSKTIVTVEAIDPKHGRTVPGSVASVGVLSGRVGDVEARLAFDDEDLAFAAICLYEHMDRGTLHPGTQGVMWRLSRPNLPPAAEEVLFS